MTPRMGSWVSKGLGALGLLWLLQPGIAAAASANLTFNIMVSLGTPTATITPTVTATPQATFTATPTVTLTPTYSPTPNSTPYYEHFEETTAIQPGGWWAVDNIQITTSGTGSAKIVTASSAKNYGLAASDTMTLDVGVNNTVVVVITEVDAATGNKVMLHEQGQPSGVEVGAGLGAGIHTLNIFDKTGWTGSKTFFIEFVVESASAGLGTRVDELWIAPAAAARYAAHFHEPAGPPSGWWTVYNSQIAGNGLDSAKVTMAAYPPSWCLVTSETLSAVEVETYRSLILVVTQVDASTGNILKLHEAGQPDGVEISRNLGSGIHTIDIPAKTGWTGNKNFYLEFIVEGASPGVGTRLDEVLITR